MYVCIMYILCMFVCIDGKLYILILLQAIRNDENPFQWKKESKLNVF